MGQIGKLRPASQFRGWRILITILYGLFSFSVNSHEISKNEVLPQVPVGGPFSLVDHTGRDVSDEDVEGEYLLVYFGFTHCPNTNPVGLFTINTALNRLGDLGRQVGPLFCTVDPARDTVDVPADYVKAFHPRMVGLTGSHEEVLAMAKTYGMDYMTGELDSEYLVYHTAFTFLMNRDGKFLRAFSRDVEIDELSHAIKEDLESREDIADSS